jgi:hypothetical protein
MSLCIPIIQINNFRRVTPENSTNVYTFSQSFLPRLGTVIRYISLNKIMKEIIMPEPEKKTSLQY